MRYRQADLLCVADSAAPVKRSRQNVFDYRRSSSEEIRGNVAAYAAELGRGDGADVVIETSGSADAFPFGLTLLRTRGRYFVPGQYSSDNAIGVSILAAREAGLWLT